MIKRKRNAAIFLTNFGFVLVSLILVVSSVTTFLPETMLAKYVISGKHEGIYADRCNNFRIKNMCGYGFGFKKIH